MEDREIAYVELEKIIPEAINGRTRALDSLVANRWTLDLLDEIADWSSWQFKFKVERNEVYDAVLIAILLKTGTISNPDGNQWRSCFRSWCYAIATHHCLNELRRQKNASKHEQKVIFLTEQISYVKPPDQQLFEKELHEQIWMLFKSLTRHEQLIIALWVNDITLCKMCEITGVPVPTLNERLHRILKKFVNAIGGADEILLEQKDHKDELRQVIAHTLAEMWGLNYLHAIAA
jgi:RNA polymerase sigma factor (sigma-70 family)